ncbi:MAG: hypothetical protein LUG47_10535 [Clostridiales bacterium]|nr:hypothetical protein [Clostridiales bacterium]
MKKALYLILLTVLLLLLAACGTGTTAGDSEATTDTPTNAASEEMAPDATDEPAETAEPKDSAGAKTETLENIHVPVRDYYICAAQYDTQMCPEVNEPLTFLTLSVDEIDMDAIQVDLACQTDMLVQISEADLTLEQYAMNGNLYLCYQDMDWDYVAENWDEEKDESEQSEQLLACLHAYDEAYAERKEAGALDWPYHVYEVQVYVGQNELYDQALVFYDETVTAATFSWPGVMETIDLGELRLSDTSPELTDRWPRDFDALGYSTSGHQLLVRRTLTKEIELDTPLFETLYTEMDIKLTGCFLLEGYENGTEITALRLVLTNLEDENDVTDMIWDGKSPVYVDAGYEIAIYPTLYNPTFAQLIQDGMMVTMLEYECQGETYYDYCTNSLYWMYDYQNLLAAYLDGVDVLSMYDCYYNLTQ